MNPNEKKIWFPAKRYGWGWGPPTCWQGWVVMFVWLGVLIAGAFLIHPDRHLTWFLGYVVALAICLIIICYFKGARPGWRWGNK